MIGVEWLAVAAVFVLILIIASDDARKQHRKVLQHDPNECDICGFIYDHRHNTRREYAKKCGVSEMEIKKHWDPMKKAREEWRDRNAKNADNDK